MKKAFLDCVNKTLQVEIAGENFTLVLKGEKIESGSVITKQGVYVTRFDFSNELPEFSIVKDNVLEEYLQKGDLSTLLGVREEYKVFQRKGSREDYFSLPFPNGFISYMETYGVMMREVPTMSEYDRWVSNNGSIYMLEVVRKWALEFEELHVDTDWEDEGTDWDEQVIQFLTVKLRD